MAAGILLKRRAARIGNYDVNNPPHKLGFHSIIALLTDGMDREEASDVRAELAAATKATKAGKIEASKSGFFQWLHTNSAGKVEIEKLPMTDEQIAHLENGGTWHGDKAIYDDRETQNETITFFCLGEPSKNLSRFKGQTGPFIHWHYERMSISKWLETLGIDAPTLRAWLETGANTGTAQGEGKRETQIRLIIETAKSLGYDCMDIPEQGKREIKNHCLANHQTYFGSDNAFRHAWNEASKGNKISISNKKKYKLNQ